MKVIFIHFIRFPLLFSFPSQQIKSFLSFPCCLALVLKSLDIQTHIYSLLYTIFLVFIHSLISISLFSFLSYHYGKTQLQHTNWWVVNPAQQHCDLYNLDIVLRVRPALDKTTLDDITTLAKSYAFDRVFGSNSTQDQIFRGVASNLVDKLIQGKFHMQARMSCVHRLLIILHMSSRACLCTLIGRNATLLVYVSFDTQGQLAMVTFC